MQLNQCNQAMLYLDVSSWINQHSVSFQIYSSAFGDHICIVDSKLESLILNIVKIDHTNDKSILNSVYNKIVFYIILNSGLGTPDNTDVVHETRAALSSVFHFYAVKPFLKKCEEEKREQIKQLTNIVMGIRLFYWHYGECVNGIENVPEALAKGINKSIHDLLNQIGNIEHKLEKFTKAIRNHYKVVYVENKSSSIQNDFKLKDLDDVQFIKSTINVLHQCVKFFHEILDILKHAQHEVSKTIAEFHEALVDIQKFTKYKNKYIVREYVPTEVVVHKFSNVAMLWKTLWKYLVAVHLLNDLDESLSLTLNEMKQPSQEIITDLTRDVEDDLGHYGEHDETNDESEITKISNSKCNLVPFRPDIPLKIGGFSHLFFIQEGFLVPGKPELGLIQYGDEFFSFSSPDEMYVFCQDADKYSLMFFETIRENPELIDFFKMKEALDNDKQHSTVLAKPEKCDSEIQTELHPIKDYFDKNYHFNAYELMRRHWKKTQSLLNCENKATKTCSMADTSTQTYDMKSVSTQESDKGTSMPKPLYYVYGLRGFDNDGIVQDKDYVPLLNFKL